MNHRKRAFTHAALLSLLHRVRKGVCFLGMAVLVSLPGSSAWAGGSFAREDLRPILDQQPVMAKWLTDGLNLPETGDALRLGQNVNRRFGGRRIGPYVILAKPKGAAGPFTLEVTVETELICQNAAGKTVDVSQAQVIQEKFSSVTVRPYQEARPNPSSGGQERPMLKKCFASLVIIGLMGSGAIAADEFPMERTGRANCILTFRPKKFGRLCPASPPLGRKNCGMLTGSITRSGAIRLAGISLGMVAKNKGGPLSIWSITITSPSKLQTQRGIRIGSTEAEVVKAYGRFRSAEDSRPGEFFVAGSIFGGVMFDFQQGRVKRIFIGAAAE